jgi:hypothetical protein
MACLEELQANVAAILEHLQNTVPCCGDSTTYGDSTFYITTIVPGQGDDPEFYGETAVADWDEWKEYLCHNAHLWVDELIKSAGSVEVALTTGGMSIGLLAAAILAVGFFVVGGFVSIPILMLGVAGLAAGISATLFEEAAEDIEAARGDIVCAILNGLSLADAVEDALSSGAAWDLFYTLIDYDSAAAILYEGGDGTTYLEAETRDDCDCEQIGEFLYYTDFETGTFEGWEHDAGPVIENGLGRNNSYAVKLGYAGGDYIYHTVITLLQAVGESPGAGDKIILHRIKFSYKMNSCYGQKLRVRCMHDTGGEDNDFDCVTSYGDEEEIIFSPPLESTFNMEMIKFDSINGATQYLILDEITVDFDYIPA